MAKRIRHLMDEADVGSGEKNAGQEETEKEMEQIAGRHPPHQDKSQNDARTKQQTIKGNADTSEEFKRMEKQRTDADRIGPVPAKGH